VRREHFADLWSRLAVAFGSHPAVEAYGLMNEPAGFKPGEWKLISQMAVEAIRRTGSNKVVLVAGDAYGGAHNWPSINGSEPWIKDPAKNIVYEAHAYFDKQHYGDDASYAAELKEDPNLANRAAQTLFPFVGWVLSNRVRGFIGEYAVPAGDVRWLSLMDNCLAILDEAGISSCYWAAGDYLPPDDHFSLQPLNNYTVDRPQLAHLLQPQAVQLP
jgi:endoglucanase